MALTHVPISSHTATGAPVIYKANCGPHQWAVADGNYDAVEALVREHVREHPSVHCPPPPRSGPLPRAESPWTVASKIIKWTMVDGSVRYTGSCVLCSPRWDVCDSPMPVDALMHEHWTVAHAADYPEVHSG